MKNPNGDVGSGGVGNDSSINTEAATTTTLSAQLKLEETRELLHKATNCLVP